ncbi:hypothetical protein AcV5_008949 [Taiwanofungus camphoratus]|nr:hypothetical protein AcV5_008949 [Antrodia cinnamomea]
MRRSSLLTSAGILITNPDCPEFLLAFVCLLSLMIHSVLWQQPPGPSVPFSAEAAVVPLKWTEIHQLEIFDSPPQMAEWLLTSSIKLCLRALYVSDEIVFPLLLQAAGPLLERLVVVSKSRGEFVKIHRNSL